MPERMRIEMTKIQKVATKTIIRVMMLKGIMKNCRMSNQMRMSQRWMKTQTMQKKRKGKAQGEKIRKATKRVRID